MQRTRRRRILRWIFFIAALVIAAMIFYFSSQDGEESSQVSGDVVRFLLKLFYPGYYDLSRKEQLRFLDNLSLWVRKGAHFSEYALFAAVLMNYLRLRLPGDRLLLSGCWGWFVATAYAGTDELHQMFVSGRGPALLDVGIDSAGALTGVLISAALLAAHIRRKRARGIS